MTLPARKRMAAAMSSPNVKKERTSQPPHPRSVASSNIVPIREETTPSSQSILDTFVSVLKDDEFALNSLKNDPELQELFITSYKQCWRGGVGLALTLWNLGQLTGEIDLKDELLKEKDAQLIQKETELKERARDTALKDAIIRQNTELIDTKTKQLKEMSAELERLKGKLKDVHEMCAD